MKKGLAILVLIVLLIAGGAWYLLSGADEFIRGQIEQQGSRYLGSAVSVETVDLALTEGRMSINGLKVKNPQTFSDNNAISVATITLDLGGAIKEPYVVQTINVNAPQILYEVDASGKGNLLALKNNLMANLPKTQKTTEKDAANPLMIVENVTVSDVRLTLNFEQLSTGPVNIEKKIYEITLPTFNAGPFGQPDGMPADKVGVAVMDAMLDKVIAHAKAEAKKRLAEEAKKKAQEELDKQKDKLLDKAKDKLKGLFN